MITTERTHGQVQAERPVNARKRQSLVREGETINAPPKAARVAPTHLDLNKNFAHYPMARDRRTIGCWRRDAKTGRWIGRLKGDNKIRFVLPADVDPQLRRFPTAFDVNLLFLLKAESRIQFKQNPNAINIPSRSYLLHALGLGADSKNLKRLREALALWSVLIILFTNWYFPNEWAGRRRIRQPAKNDIKRLPPPIRSVSPDQRIIKLSQPWLDLLADDKYWKRVPLPLPREAAAQNLALCLLVSMKREQDVTEPRRVRQLCRKIGINHHERLQVLKHAYDSVRKYFKSNHLRQLCDHILYDGKIAFQFKRAKQRPKIKAKKVMAPLPSDQPKITRPKLKMRTRTVIEEIEKEGLIIEHVIPIADDELPIPEEDLKYGRVGHWVTDDV